MILVLNINWQFADLLLFNKRRIMKTKKETKRNMAKKLLRVRSLSCNNLHSDLCIMRTQDTFAWWRWRQRQRWGVCIFTYYNTRPWWWEECTTFPSVPFWNHLIPRAFFFLFFCSWMSDRQLCSFKYEGEREREREFLPLIVFWGVWSQYHGVFEKIGYAIKLNIVMLEWSSTQLWSPDAIFRL